MDCESVLKFSNNILDILDTLVQNRPVIAGPCLAQRHEGTKNSQFLHLRHLWITPRI